MEEKIEQVLRYIYYIVGIATSTTTIVKNLRTKKRPKHFKKR